MIHRLLFILLVIFTTSALAKVPIQQWKTDKNIQVLFVPDDSNELISVNFALKGAGSKTDPQGKAGLTYLTLQLLFERTTEGSTRFEIEKNLKSLGVLNGFQYEVGLDNIFFSFKCPKENLKAVLDQFKIFIATPTFDQKELAKMKNFDPNNARLSTSTEQQFASKTLIQNFFANSPYAIPAGGTLEGRQSITIKDIQAALKDRFARDILTFSVVGDITPKALSTHIDHVFGQLPAQANLPSLSEVVIHTNGDIRVIPKNSQQSGVYFGQAGLSRTDQRFLPLVILNDVLGGRAFTSRLWLTAREEQGLVYNIETSLFDLEQASLLIGNFESSNQTVDKVIQLIQQEWEKIKNTGITPEEFSAAKTSLIGRFALNFTSPTGISRYLLTSYLDGLPADHINQRNAQIQAITLEEVNKVAISLLDPQQLSFVVVGNPE